MADIPYSEFYKSLADGTAGTLENIGNAAASLACGLWSSYPAFMAGTGINDPSTQMMSALYDRMCKPRNQEPPPPQKPFNGGQCNCVQYRINYTNYLGGSEWYTADTTQYGPLSGPSIEGDGPNKSYGLYVGAPGCGERHRYNFISGFENWAIAPNAAFCTINSITRVDGSPDDCGDPPPQYPPVVVPPGDLTTNAPVTINNTSVVVPVTIIPTTIVAPVYIRPTLNVDVGGVNVNFDLGGLTISLPNPSGGDKTLPPGKDPRTNPPTSRPPLGGTNIDLKPIERKLDALKDLLDQVKECACGGESGVTLQGQTLGSGTSGWFDLPVDTVAVVVTVTKLAENVKTEKGLTAPDVYYAGWGWFTFQGGMTERLPLDAGIKCYPWTNEFNPEKFGYTCRIGYTASVIAYKRVES